MIHLNELREKRDAVGLELLELPKREYFRGDSDAFEKWIEKATKNPLVESYSPKKMGVKCECFDDEEIGEFITCENCDTVNAFLQLCRTVFKEEREEIHRLKLATA